MIRERYADILAEWPNSSAVWHASFGLTWEVVRDAFGHHDVPSTLIGVTVLGYDHQLVEVEAIAAVRD